MQHPPPLHCVRQKSLHGKINNSTTEIFGLTFGIQLLVQPLRFQTAPAAKRPWFALSSMAFQCALGWVMHVRVLLVGMFHRCTEFFFVQ